MCSSGAPPITVPPACPLQAQCLRSPPRSPTMTDAIGRFGALRRPAPLLGVLGAIAAVLGGCAVGPNYVRPDTPVAQQFAGTPQGPYFATGVQGKFWSQFGDPTLDQLVDDALVANHDLRIALGSLKEARAEHRAAKLDLLPTVTASGGYTEER